MHAAHRARHVLGVAQILCSCRGNNPGAMVEVDEEKMTRETKLQKWAT